ncbi:STAS/SEC14 domain-containing protein [Flavobacterium sp.]|uniref:STAS/SEC14 domain-containing protein n=1 Tax=Flavobacterium sp. TaxID=239 RepID=UPI00403454B7
MIIQIPDLPHNMVGFRADGEVTAEDFEIIKLQVSHLVEKTGKLNYMLVLDNSPADFTLGAWLQDALLGLQNITKWNRAAILSDSDTLKTFTDVFSKVMPGEFRAYKHAQYDNAVDWVSERSEDESYNN